MRTCLDDSVGYNMTNFPNWMQHRSAEDASTAFPSVETCHPYMTRYLCSLYFPKCLGRDKPKIPPCKQFCTGEEKKFIILY